MSSTPLQSQTVTPETMTRATRVGPKASIGDIRLVDHRAILRQSDFVKPEAVRVTQSFSVERESGGSSIRVQASIHLDIASDSDESKQKPPVSITAVYSLAYRIADLEKLEDADLAAFAQVNGAFNVWPFWRELCHSALGRMGLPPMVMPTMRIAVVSPESDEKTKN